MPVDPFAVLHALMRAEASRAQRADHAAPEPGAPAPDSAQASAPEPPSSRNEPVR
ncbi:hypothetical protein ACFUGD_16590 [Streptomyces sp. NPDC057217]|uniref:hypothetical protein n=1 Tax=unclassified Streptomyces TaxID=2593676 RepID=UPI00363BFF12